MVGEDGERSRGETLGGEVDVLAVKGGGGDEEDGLGHGPGLEMGFDLLVEFDHVGDVVGLDTIMSREVLDGVGSNEGLNARQGKTMYKQ